MLCPKCSHKWEYKGKSKLYATCPNCYRKIRVISDVTTSPLISNEVKHEEQTDPILLRAIIQEITLKLKGISGSIKAVEAVPVQEVDEDGIIKEALDIVPEYRWVKIKLPCFTQKHLPALNAKYDEIMKGLCDGSLHSDAWCPSCEGYIKEGDKYIQVGLEKAKTDKKVETE
jgi:hypothetical protein